MIQWILVIILLIAALLLLYKKLFRAFIKKDSKCEGCAIGKSQKA